MLKMLGSILSRTVLQPVATGTIWELRGARQRRREHGEATWTMARPHGPGQGCREHGGDSWNQSQSQVGVGGTGAGPQGI